MVKLVNTGDLKSPDASLAGSIPAGRTISIPIAAAKRIADLYGYDQVVIIARAVGVQEHVTTYGKNKLHCEIAAKIGNFFKYKLMGWPE
jgi:acetylornithine/succinyldiaminopimelate/putrescine aminotransferase